MAANSVKTKLTQSQIKAEDVDKFFKKPLKEKLNKNKIINSETDFR